MQKQITLVRLMLFLIAAIFVSAACSPSASPTAAPVAQTTEAPSSATADVTESAADGEIEVSIESTPEVSVTVPVPRAPEDGSTIDGTEVPVPSFEAPPTLDDLLAQYPDLQPYLDQIAGVAAGDLDLGTLYQRMAQIYNEQGASGLAVFLQESGLMETLGLPMSYLELLPIYEAEGITGVEREARVRGLISSRDELVAYLAIDEQANLPALTETLTGLGVSVYDYLPNSSEVEIGIALEVLAQYQTPGSLLDYLLSIAQAEHVVGFRLPERVDNQAGLDAQTIGGSVSARIGADLWNAAGFTGEGIRIGVMDLGFAGISELAGDELPDEDAMTTNLPIDELNEQADAHGTAVATVVHRIAPDAELFIAYFDGSSFSSFMDALEFLAENNVQIVNASFGSMLGPRDGTWGQTVIVSEFIEENDILWVNAAGNEAQKHTLFEYREGEAGFHDFGDEDYLMPFLARSEFVSITMNWNGNWDGEEENNYQIVVFDEDGDEIAVGAESKRGRRNDLPFQFASFEADPNEIYYFAVGRTRGDENHTIDITVEGGRLADWGRVAQYSVGTPADSPAALTVGAVGLTADLIEDYSSQGPTPDGRLKPEISAPTGEIVPFYEDNGFTGTSGAAPVVAGAAALVMQAFPEMSRSEVMAYLTENVTDLGDPGEDITFGTGRLALPADEIGIEDTTAPEGDPFAVITQADVLYNVRRDGERGIEVTMSFELNNFEGREIAAGILFGDVNFNPIEPADDDFAVGETLGLVDRIEVRKSRASFSDLVFFIPYEAFEDLEFGVEFIYQIVILDLSEDDLVILAQDIGFITLTRKSN